MLDRVPVFRAARAICLWAFALFLVFSVAGGLLLRSQAQALAVAIDPIQNEHRFTTLETKVEVIAQDLKEMRQYNWAVILGLAGLLGEAGIRIVKKPPKEGGG